nr:MAG: hypothetical protein [Betatorquevirus sp.]
MSSMYTPTEQSGRYLTQQWINSVLSIHDTFCQCKKPLVHLLKGIKETTIGLTEEEKKLTEKCLTAVTTEDTTDRDGPDPEDILDGVDLEAFFAGDITEEEDTG